MNKHDEIIALIEDTYDQLKAISKAMEEGKGAISEENPFKLFRILANARETLAEAMKTTGFAVEIAEAEQNARTALKAAIEVEAMYLRDIKQDAMRVA